MTEILLFGGTSEGRALAGLLKQKGASVQACVATEYGEALLEAGGSLSVRTGRLDEGGILSLLKAERPRLVIDATHPYAQSVSGNLQAACRANGAKYLRVLRRACSYEGCAAFGGMDALTAWLNAQTGVIFSTLGAKEAAALTAVSGFKERIWLRVLPCVNSLEACLEAGFPARHVICMQGPFSAELNAAMLRAASADILVTKESGAAGGFPEKREAARRLGITLAVLERPEEANGRTLQELIDAIQKGAL